MTLFLLLGFTLICYGPAPGKPYGVTMLDHPYMAKYIPIKPRVKCWLDV